MTITLDATTQAIMRQMTLQDNGITTTATVNYPLSEDALHGLTRTCTELEGQPRKSLSWRFLYDVRPLWHYLAACPPDTPIELDETCRSYRALTPGCLRNIVEAVNITPLDVSGVTRLLVYEGLGEVAAQCLLQDEATRQHTQQFEIVCWAETPTSRAILRSQQWSDTIALPCQVIVIGVQDSVHLSLMQRAMPLLDAHGGVILAIAPSVHPTSLLAECVTSLPVTGNLYLHTYTRPREATESDAPVVVTPRGARLTTPQYTEGKRGQISLF